jgi:hypothetical protein
MAAEHPEFQVNFIQAIYGTNYGSSEISTLREDALLDDLCRGLSRKKVRHSLLVEPLGTSAINACLPVDEFWIARQTESRDPTSANSTRQQ